MAGQSLPKAEPIHGSSILPAQQHAHPGGLPSGHYSTGEHQAPLINLLIDFMHITRKVNSGVCSGWC